MTWPIAGTCRRLSLLALALFMLGSFSLAHEEATGRNALEVTGSKSFSRPMAMPGKTDAHRGSLAAHTTGKGAPSTPLMRNIDMILLCGSVQKTPEAASEAVLKDRRRAEKSGEEMHLAKLAMSLRELSCTLFQRGQKDEALRAERESLVIVRKLAKQNPEFFQTLLADKLIDYSKILHALGRTQEAIAPLQEAVDIQRTLAKQSPAFSLNKLLSSLRTLADYLLEAGDKQAALMPAREIVDIHRKLAKRNPNLNLPYLARSLEKFARRLEKAGHPQEGIEALQEAVSIYRQLAKRFPEKYLSEAARVLGDMAYSLEDMGRMKEALKAAREAVALRRRLADNLASPLSKTNQSELADSLDQMADLLFAMGRAEEALKVDYEAVSIYRGFTRQDPIIGSSQLATRLQFLADRLFKLGKTEEAITTLREAEALHRKLMRFPDLADIETANLSEMLHKLARYLAKMKRWSEALQAAQESVAHCRRVVAQIPDAGFALAKALNTLGDVYMGLKQPRKAVRAYAEGLQILLQPLEELPEPRAPFAARLILHYEKACKEAKEKPDEKLITPLRHIIEKIKNSKMQK